MLEAVQKDIDVYRENFARFERAYGDSGPIWLRSMRKEALARFEELGFPSTRDEDWKYINFAPLTRVEFRAAPAESLPPTALGSSPFSRLDGPRVVFVNGAFSPDLSDLTALPEGVRLAPLSRILEEEPELIEGRFGKLADFSAEPFVALNTAFAAEGAVLIVAPNQIIEEPVQMIFLAGEQAEDTVSHPRNWVLVGRNSQVKVVETHASVADKRYFSNVVSEFYLEENAVVDHYKIDDESPQAFHVNRTMVHQARSSNYVNNFSAFGGSLVRNNIGTVLDGEGAECTLNGLFVTRGSQTVDNHTTMEHARAHCESHELYKGILDDKSRGVFHGRIIVRQDAQKTDSKQTNDNLLLSDNALVSTKPQLEIYADDVKCTHGATIGQLDEESLFYLRSRGIPKDAARSLLIYAFASSVLDRVSYRPLRQLLLDRLAERMPDGRLIREVD